MNKKVICFGEILWDNLPNGRLAGGAPMNVAYHLRNLGVDASLISRVGNDQAGQDLIDFISSIGIPTNLIQLDNHEKTSEVIGELKDGNEMVYTITYPTAWDYIAWQNSYQQLIENTDMLIYGSLASRHSMSRQTLLKVLEAANYKVFDVNLRLPHYEKNTLRELLHQANLVKVNENEIEVLGNWFTFFSKEEDRVKALQELFNIDEIIITKGANGSAYYSKNQQIAQNSFAVEVVDTVGSGDAFLAGFLAKKLESQSHTTCLNYASALGAYVASKAGGCPPYNGLTTFMDEHLLSKI